MYLESHFWDIAVCVRDPFAEANRRTPVGLYAHAERRGGELDSPHPPTGAIDYIGRVKGSTYIRVRYRRVSIRNTNTGIYIYIILLYYIYIGGTPEYRERRLRRRRRRLFRGKNNSR